MKLVAQFIKLACDRCLEIHKARVIPATSCSVFPEFNRNDGVESVWFFHNYEICWSPASWGDEAGASSTDVGA